MRVRPILVRVHVRNDPPARTPASRTPITSRASLSRGTPTPSASFTQSVNKKKRSGKKRSEFLKQQQQFTGAVDDVQANVPEGTDVAPADVKVWGGGSKAGTTFSKVEVSAPAKTPSHLRGTDGKVIPKPRANFAAARRKNFHEARDALYGEACTDCDCDCDHDYARHVNSCIYSFQSTCVRSTHGTWRAYT